MKLFVTGTDTGVGKTVVTAGLLTALAERGKRAAALKLVETGCERNEHGKLVPADGCLLHRCSSAGQSLDEVCPYRFEPPVAPLVAAEVAGVKLKPTELLSRIDAAEAASDILVIEGAGGLLVPIAENYTFADLLAERPMPVLVVVGSKLGAINHSLLTFEVLRTRGTECLGYVLNDLHSNSGESAVDTNRALLGRVAERYSVNELAYVPRLEAGQHAGSMLHAVATALSHQVKS